MKVSDVLSSMVARDTENPEAAFWNGKIDRGIAKRPTMTYGYSATLMGWSDQIKEEVKKRNNKYQTPYLGADANDTTASMYLAKLVLPALKEVVVKAAEMMEWLKKMAVAIAKAGVALQWVTPSGMIVKHYYFKQDTTVVNTFFGKTRIRYNISTDTTDPDSVKNKAAIAPNLIHSLDASHLVLTVNRCATEGITDFAMIHDSFGCHACDMVKLNRLLREEFIKMYSGDVLQDLITQIVKQLPAELYEEVFEQAGPVPTMGNLDLNQVKESLYFFA
jgi:DNA-directed RNA polymerase